MAIVWLCPPDSQLPLSPHACVEAIRERRDELVDVGYCRSLNDLFEGNNVSVDDLSSSREPVSRSVPHMMFSRIVKQH